MRRLMRMSIAATAAALMLALPACSSEQTTTSGTSSEAASSAESNAEYPITIKHALGETKIEKKPERIATLGWCNHEIPLAFGVMPVGMSTLKWADDDHDGILPWDEEKIKELGGETPVLFDDEADSIPFEQVADTKPDVILAAYSGLTQEDYDKLSKIAPVVAYPNKAWATSTSDIIKLNAIGMGMEDKAAEFQKKVDDSVAAALDKYPNLKDKKFLFAIYGSQDKSKIGFYTLDDPRAGLLKTIGLGVPKIVEEETPKSDSFWVELSAEQPELFEDVDVIISYGSNDAATNEKTLKDMQADPLLSKIPAIRDGHVAFLGEGPVAAAAGGSPAGLIWGVDKYFEIVSKAAG